jgi:hypothetical protein
MSFCKRYVFPQLISEITEWISIKFDTDIGYTETFLPNVILIVILQHRPKVLSMNQHVDSLDLQCEIPLIRALLMKRSLSAWLHIRTRAICTVCSYGRLVLDL